MSNEEIVMKIQAGQDVRDNLSMLYTKNVRILTKWAMPLVTYRIELVDLLQEAYFGLQSAAEKYDPSTGCKFLTFAVWDVRHAMQRYVQNCGDAVRLPVHMHDKIALYQQFVTQYRMECGRDPDIKTICEGLNISRTEYDSIDHALSMQQVESLDRPLPGDREDMTLKDVLPDHGVSVDDAVTCEALKESISCQLWRIIDRMKKNQRQIIIETLIKGRTLEAVSKEMNVSIQSVAMLRNEGLKAIRKSPGFKQLETDVFDCYGLAVKCCGIEKFRRTQTSSTEYVAMLLLEHERKFNEKIKKYRSGCRQNAQDQYRGA